jgi:hypothetical protein
MEATGAFANNNTILELHFCDGVELSKKSSESE